MSNVVILENDEERDRKTCIALDVKANGANRELAQWLLDHPRYFNTVVAEWLRCSETRIRYLRKWASRGFSGTHFDKNNQPKSGSKEPSTAPLKSLDNLEMPTEEEADESWQNDVYDQACLLLERMADETRQRFFAHIKEVYGNGQD